MLFLSLMLCSVGLKFFDASSAVDDVLSMAVDPPLQVISVVTVAIDCVRVSVPGRQQVSLSMVTLNQALA
jgi:hypothetical protein